ncbi:DUF1028 domain-containing protein [Tropicimonas sediminicola]|uniref:Uncharacterized conserved protein, Ntn-hydrolase superfamily n=1 Tax=Tropicimonas sediminicola TaxID=1031541 RepID=A0A239CAG1_9RHOB|nr:DUF1028 domain-containing protein [Tropicimonas sediminicola]SNS17236.1 Uncharacterized conserved protein, Ntn-hydrolase superfamily [Tropicimonas sediminicola]
MTFSLLAFDRETGAIGAAAATGNLCVGGWVLRGDPRFGITAAQGHTPSTIWGEDALGLLAQGATAQEALDTVIAPDPGREMRQLAILERGGRTAVHDGARNRPYTGHLEGDGWIAAGNWLASGEVLAQAAEALARPGPALADRLVAGLRAGIAAGSDRRGTLSAALLVLAETRPPLDLRVDLDPSPVDRLEALLERTGAPEYSAWLDTLPTRQDPHRT